MKVSELSDQETAILCRFLRGQGGTSARGSVTIDPTSLVRGLPPRLQAGARRCVERLYSKGFLSRKPKPDDCVYSLKTDLPQDLDAVIQELKANPDLCITARTGKTQVPEEAAPSQVDAKLENAIRSIASKGRHVMVKSINVTEHEEEVGEEGGSQIRMVNVSVEIKCPVTGISFESVLMLGWATLFVDSGVQCPICGNTHTMRGPSLIY